MRHAGAIFLGRHTPEAMGDYIAGPNHVLPTSRTARFSSGLSVLDFMKRTTLAGPGRQHASPPSAPMPSTLAEAEGLEAHARSIAARLNRKDGKDLTVDYRLSAITLDEASVVHRTRAIEQEREIAIYDLLEANSFQPEGSPGGPYQLILGVEENRLVLRHQRWKTAAPHGKVHAVADAVAQDGEGLFPGLRKLLQGDPHRAAVPDRGAGHGAPRPARRRREQLQERLEGKIEIDFDTARRLFTLICVLQMRG